MTTRPELDTDINALPGLAAVALFVVFVVTIVTSELPEAVGFGGFEGTPNITAGIGFALFNMEGTTGTIPSEGFLAPFEIIAVLLVAALVVAVMLARREGQSLLERKRGGEP